VELPTKILIGVGGFAAAATAVGVYQHQKNTAAAAASGGRASVGGPQSRAVNKVVVPTRPIQAPLVPSGGQTTADVYLSVSGTINAVGVGTIGSLIMVHVSPGATLQKGAIDGIPWAVAPGSTTARLTTTRSSGSAVVSWTDASGAAQSTVINYGTLPPAQVGVFPGVSVVLPSGGGNVTVNGAGVPGTNLFVTAPGTIVSPYTIDGNDVQINPSSTLTVPTQNRSGRVDLYTGSGNSGDPWVPYSIFYGA
jgi:hypothetical protein